MSSCLRQLCPSLPRSALVAGALAFLLLPPRAAAQSSKAPGEDRIRPGDRLCVETAGIPNGPGRFVTRVESSGKAPLGAGYGRVQVKGMTVEEAEDAIRRHLGKTWRDPAVQVTRYDPLVEGETSLGQQLARLEREVRALRVAVAKLRGKGD